MTSNKLFVYGIFLDELQRESYGMTAPHYATVRGYATVAAHDRGVIVEAIKVSRDFCLTGLVVEVPPKVVSPYGVLSNWERLDRLEGAYDRILITTTDGDKCWMYVSKGSRKWK